MADSPPWEMVRYETVRKIVPLQNGYTTSPRSAWAQRTLADLRHADASDPGADPALWEITLGGLPTELTGTGDDPSWTERAIHAALVLYATHQQSRPEPMHRRGVGLGQAVRQLSRARSGAEWDPGTISRFHALVRAQSSMMQLQNLRGLVTLMRGESIGLDYGQLAADLWLLNSDGADRVLLRWGRQLHRAQPTPTDAETKTTSPTTEGEPS